jgi:hypothetical protein
MEASLRQMKALAIVPKVSSLLSLLSSAYIIYDVIRIYCKNRKNFRLYHSILFGMSVCDFASSAAWFFTTWPIPSDVLPVYGANGTQGTCAAQGFFAQFSIATVFYSAFLALYYLLVIKFGWSERRLKNARLGPTVHAVSLTFGLGTSTVCVALGLMNPIGWDCWISAVPLGCEESWLSNGETTCTRGDNAKLYQWVFFYLPLWISTFLVTLAMCMVHSTFKKVSNATKRWQHGHSQAQADRNKLVTTQALLYVGSFYFVWLFPTILRIHEITNDGVVLFHFVFLSAMFVPLQGLLNLFIYLRPKLLERRRKCLIKGTLKETTTTVNCTTDQKEPEDWNINNEEVLDEVLGECETAEPSKEPIYGDHQAGTSKTQLVRSLNLEEGNQDGNLSVKEEVGDRPQHAKMVEWVHNIREVLLEGDEGEGAHGIASMEIS